LQIIKAFNLYRRKTGTQKYFWVHLDKQVPTGAGLGGGSGNAATALWAANQMNGNIASEKELQAWSAEIGSDCPFFFSQGVAYCTSRGEVNGYSHFSESNHLSILSFGCLEKI
jgi:4-diphosphocytidyl-2-C-methyl-D-erythritol kinase